LRLEERDPDVVALLEHDAHAHPIATDSAGQFTMLVIRRSPRCSSSSTIAIAYGWSGAGTQGW
jgi:hypothetical protein